MSRKVDPAAIGGFVLGALVLLIGAILVFSGDRFFTRKLNYVMYFDGSVQGLSIGAPVALRGVKIGTVKDISVLHQSDNNEIAVPVTIEIIGKKIRSSGAEHVISIDQARDQIQKLVSHGLRATLALQSLVTGQLYVELEFMQGVKQAKVVVRDGVFIFPTEVSRLSELAEEVQALPLAELANKTMTALDGVSKVFGSPEILDTLKSVERAAAGMDTLVADLNIKLDTLTGDLQTTVKATDKLLNKSSHAVSDIGKGLDSLLVRFNAVADRSEETLIAARDTIATYQALPSQDSMFGFELFQLLRELSAASRSIRSMADYLEQHPEALIKGKPGGQDD
ncbi:MAG: MlaD family protein [Gammaproteobacteria bacterium]